MCRHLAYLGPEVSLASLILDAEHSLLKQSYLPQQQNRGVVNADGFGVGWFAPAVRPEPALYRSTEPIWADPSFASFAPVVSSPALMAAVRSATPPNPVERSGVAPYNSGRWLFSHNGSVDGYRPEQAGAEPGVRAEMIASLPPGRLAALEGAADSELIFGMVLEAVEAGEPVHEALAAVIARMTDLAECRLNLLLTDGQELWATAYGESLHVRCADDHILIASEPIDRSPGWDRLPDKSIVRATAGSMKVDSL